MDFWRLLSPAAADGTLLIGHHNPWVGGAAFFLAVVGASVLVPAVNRYRGHQHRYVWLLGGALTMGLGFWGMHFASMLAYHLPVIHGYDRTHSLLSMVPVIVACGLCIFLCSFNRSPPYHVVLAALVLGIGIAGTHFWGMEAMRLPVAMHYKPGLFFVSLLAAFVLPLGALLSVHWLRKKVSHHSNALPLVATLAVGLSVCAFHILAMSATYFVVTDPSVLVTTHPVPRGLMAAIVLVAILVVLLLIGLLLDRRWVDLSQSLARSEQRFTRMAQNSGVAIFTYNQNGVVYANPALSTILGYDKKEIETLPLAEVLGQDCADFALGAINGKPVEGENFQSQFEVTTKSGHVRWIYLSISVERKCQALIGLASSFDITSQKLAESNYRKLAYKDSLTRLANRAMFIDRVEHHLALLNRRGGNITSCILLIDLDKFKVTNDTLGHAHGDQLLQAVGERLLACSRSSDTVARLGGDEFVILAEGADDIYDIQAIAEKIIEEFKTPLNIGVQQVQVEISMGALPIVPKAYNSSDDILRDADIAMYRAKKVNGSYWVIFNEELDASARRMRQLQIELKQTIEQGSLQFFYQPIIDIAEQRVVGFESLARWQRETGEWVSPAEFIPLAERSGSVSDIGLWALKRAAQQVAQWSARFNRRDIYISINIAAVSFGDERFYQLLDDMFAQYDLAPGQIRIELTERILMENADMVLPKLEKLLQMGCNLMLDDFGTGYSSLSYLHRLPINTVKIDRSFIESLNQDQQAPAIVKSIVGLAENLNMSVISEGVETPQQSAQLLDLGCQVVQGFLYSKPMPPEAAEAYYEQYNSTGNIVSDDSLAANMM